MRSRISFKLAMPMSIHIAVRAHQAIADFVFGIGLYSAEGVNCYGTNTHLEEFTPQELRGEGDVTFSIDESRTRGRYIQARRRRSQARRVSLRLPPAAVHLPRQVAQQGSGDLSAKRTLGLSRRASELEREGQITKNVKRKNEQGMPKHAEQRRGHIRFSFFSLR